METTNLRWVRARDGMLGGVCTGVARGLDVGVGVVRLAWVIAVLFLGCGVLAYLLCWIALPRDDRLDRAHEKRMLGVCARLSQRGDIEVGLARLAALTLLLMSAGTAIVGYILLYAVLPSDDVVRVH